VWRVILLSECVIELLDNRDLRDKAIRAIVLEMYYNRRYIRRCFNPSNILLGVIMFILLILAIIAIMRMIHRM
jgi:hypothetical protein